MSSPLSQKRAEMRTESIVGKSVKKLPGIAETLGNNLERAGYNQITDVYSKAQSMDFNEKKFKGWLMSTSGANKRQASECYQGIRDWNQQFDPERTFCGAKSPQSQCAYRPRNK